MQVSRVHSSDAQIFINDNRLIGVSSFNFSSNRSLTDLRGLHSFDVDDRITNDIPETEVSFDWTLGNGMIDPFFGIATGQLLSVENFVIKSKDLVGTNVFSGAYINSYKVNGSVGELVNGSVSYEVDDYSWNTGKLVFEDQTEDEVKPFLASRITVTPTNLEGGVSSSGLSIQSFSLDVPIARKVVKRVGSLVPVTRYPELPVVGQLDFSILKNTLTGMGSAKILQKGDAAINLKDCSYDGETTFVAKNCNLISISESLSLDGNSQIDFSYRFSLDTGFYQSVEGDLFYNGFEILFNGEPIFFNN